jgi:hypothetical protein
VFLDDTFMMKAANGIPFAAFIASAASGAIAN